MDDPRFAEIMYRVESHISQADQAVLRDGAILPKDSSVKSALRKAELGLVGKKQVNPPKDELEKWIAGLADSLIVLAKELELSHGVSKGDFLTTLAEARKSLDIRREMAGTPCGYLEFLAGFLKQMKNA